MTDTVDLKGSDATLPWLRNARFDIGFIFGLIALSCITGLVILSEPTLFYPILAIDLWFLGYHHVISTFTRICFDKESFQEHKFLMVGLLPIVVVLITPAKAGVSRVLIAARIDRLRMKTDGWIKLFSIRYQFLESSADPQSSIQHSSGWNYGASLFPQ
jgi:hypothetical protein